ncbi:MAG: glycogen/starch/alpha-glucan phosphorylase [Elusimicrobia bacterium]|nr:glycogen/starch/alpha-glucan phosphorylase [Elusimicrobiota bacterium]
MSEKSDVLPPPKESRNGMCVDDLKQSFQDRRTFSIAKDEYTATRYDDFMTASFIIRDRMIERWIKTQQRYHKQNLKRVYYLSMEFLIGRLLMHGILNLGIAGEMRQALRAYGLDLDEVCDQEPDAGLGNGGLGRLAACFMDSMATLGVPANGYGIMYEYGIFRQKILNGWQVELPDKWLQLGTPWAIGRPEYTIRVRFYGRTRQFFEKGGRLRVVWTDTEDVLAMPYDIPVPGYKNDVVNYLRLWSSKGTEEFELDYFNHGDYVKAYDKKISSENISKVLYPNDQFSAGMELRLKQEYFFSAASLADIIRRFKAHNPDIRDFPNKVAIQLNDTHPSLAIVELMRILLDEERLDWDSAFDITVNTFAYTNHTLMPEALETWPAPLLGKLLPRHLEIIYEINARFMRDVANHWIADVDRLRRMSLIVEGDVKRVRMAHLSIIGSHSVNGVSELHSSLLKKTLFADFYGMFPERFNNKTNGVTPRRWFLDANPLLAGLITRAIGDSWTTNLGELKKLLPLREDASFRKDWQAVKHENKKIFAAHVKKTTGIAVDPESIFDMQVKRIHEYKRQALFALFLIHHYLRLKRDPNGDYVSRTAFFGGKSAPGYAMAKLIIKFINSIAGVINGDKSLRGRLKVVFLEDYRVTLAQRVIPAADISEQISTAGTEASGTGNMKFMMNGALTLGTWDGANIEIAEEVGPEHIFIFGLKAHEVAEFKGKGYRPEEYLGKSPALQEVFRLIRLDFFSHVEPGIFTPILDAVTHSDPFMILADFEDYVRAQDEAEKRYKDQTAWTNSSIVNVAKSGRFSSDRTIREYARDIWGVPTR